MKKRFHRRPGKLIQAKPLTDSSDKEYDVIAVNTSTREIISIGKIKAMDEAKELKEEHRQDGFKYYILEINSVLLELE